MKKILYLILFLSFFIVTKVSAAGPEISLSCPTVISSSNKCSVVLKNSQGEDYEVYDFNVKISGPASASQDHKENASDGEIGTISIKPTSSSGTVKVEVDITLKKDEESYNYNREATMNIVSSINTLNSITIGDKKITITNKNLTTYSAEVKEKEVNISAVATDKTATITGTGSKTLACGDNKVTLSVKATSGSSKDYTLNIKRKCEENVLKGIILSSGTLNPTFKKDTKDYKVTVSKEIDKITIKAVKGFDKQKITGEVENASLLIGENNNFTITATDEDNKEIKYNIQVIRDENLSSTAYLKDLSLSSGKIKFDSNVFEYKTKVLYDVNKITVYATPQDSSSKVTFTGHDKLEVGENKVTVTVTTSNNESKDYVIYVNRLKEGETLGDNANIKNIVINGYTLNFDYNKTDYKLVIGDEEKLDISVEMDDEFASYQIAGNHSLKNKSVIKIITKSADDENTKTYNIEVVKSSKTILYIIGGIILALLIGGAILAYFLINKKKKKETDINGFKITEEEADAITTDRIIPEDTLVSAPIITNEDASNEQTIDINNFVTCPFCSKTISNISSDCPYCGKKLY